MKTNFAISTIIAATLLLSGCSYLSSKSATNPTTQKKQICVDLKRQMSLDIANGPTDTPYTATQQAEMMRTYSKNGCEQLENK
jgi:PBP1b-binding outer membrane lipoprotein LpoB